MSRSKRYQALLEKIDQDKTYEIEEAIKLVLETATTSFAGSVELHVRLGIDPKKGEQQVRSTVNLPHGSGKVLKIAAFAEGDQAEAAKKAGADLVGDTELIEKIIKTKKIEFDIAIATPDIMRTLAKAAKILGPKGLMPSPKNETVSRDMAKTVEELKKGKLAFKNDDSANLHLVIGKTNFTAEQLQENLVATLEAINKAKPATSKGAYIKKLSINATMGPGIQLTLS